MILIDSRTRSVDWLHHIHHDCSQKCIGGVQATSITFVEIIGESRKARRDCGKPREARQWLSSW